MVMVNDHDSPALAVAVAVDVPECAPAPPPPADPAPPNAPLIIDVSTTCADPVLEDGRADFVRLNPNWLFLGGPGELTYDWSVVTGTTVVQSFQGWFNASGVYVSFLQPLAPGEYTASINAAGFPALGNSVTFTIDDCTLQPQPDPVPLAIYGVTTLCLPGDATESAVWVVEQHGTVQPAWFEWTIRDDAMLSVDTDSPVTILDDQPTPLSSRALPLGTMHLTVTGVADPAVTASATFDIGPCTAPVGPGRPERSRPIRPTPTDADRRERSHELDRPDRVQRAGGHDVAPTGRLGHDAADRAPAGDPLSTAPRFSAARCTVSVHLAAQIAASGWRVRRRRSDRGRAAVDRRGRSPSPAGRRGAPGARTGRSR